MARQPPLPLPRITLVSSGRERSHTQGDQQGGPHPQRRLRAPTSTTILSYTTNRYLTLGCLSASPLSQSPARSTLAPRRRVLQCATTSTELAEEPGAPSASKRKPRNTTFTRRDLHGPPGSRRSGAAGSHRPLGRPSAEPLLAGAELLHGPLGVSDGRGVVPEEELGHRAPAGPFLYGVGYDLCLAGRLAGSACGLSHCRRYDHASANRTGCECHDELSHRAPPVFATVLHG